MSESDMECEGRRRAGDWRGRLGRGMGMAAVVGDVVSVAVVSVDVEDEAEFALEDVGVGLLEEPDSSRGRARGWGCDSWRCEGEK